MWKQGPLSIHLNGLSKTIQNQNTERTGNQSGCPPSCGLELRSSLLHITLAQRVQGSEHRVHSLATGLASTCCEAGQAPHLPGSSVSPSVTWGLQQLPHRMTLRIKLLMGVKVPFKLWHTYINVGISRSYNVNRGDFFFIKSK